METGRGLRGPFPRRRVTTACSAGPVPGLISVCVAASQLITAGTGKKHEIERSEEDNEQYGKNTVSSYLKTFLPYTIHYHSNVWNQPIC